MSMKRFFVCGTDTGIGKTMVSLLLMRALFQRNESPYYYKWLQTGCTGPYDEDSDARFVYSRTPELARCDPSLSVGWCFGNPKAPYHAAKDEGVSLDRHELVHALQRICEQHETIVTEAAGGLMVPVLPGAVMILDLMTDAARFGFQPLLGARAGLGTINHTILSINALKAAGIPPVGVIMVQGPEPTGPREVRENQEAIYEATGIRVLGVIPRIQNAYNPPESAFEPFAALLDSKE